MTRQGVILTVIVVVVAYTLIDLFLYRHTHIKELKTCQVVRDTCKEFCGRCEKCK